MRGGATEDARGIETEPGMKEATSHGAAHPCPRYGSRSVARIAYGEPEGSDEMFRKMRSGEIALGGCFPMPEQYLCNECANSR